MPLTLFGVMKLPELRKALKLSQRRLDKLAGVARGTTFNIESGKTADPGLSDCMAIVEALRKAGMPGITVEQIEFSPTHAEVSR